MLKAKQLKLDKSYFKKYLLETIILISFSLTIIIMLFLPFNIENEEKFESLTNNYINIKTNTIATVPSLIKGATPNYNNPIIPIGFKAINTTDANWDNIDTDWNNGLVIEDEKENQFVWVPIDGTNVKYEKNLNLLNENMYVSDDINYLPKEIDNEYTQIEKYKGFYISRYEAGIPDTHFPISNFDISKKYDKDTIPVFKKGVSPYNYINYWYSKNLSEKIYLTSNVRSGLVTGTQWDSLTNWLNYSGYDINNSKKYGNYSIYNGDIFNNSYSNLILTGSNENFKTNNIYDLAGNVAEISTELTNFLDSTIKDEYKEFVKNEEIQLYSNRVIIRGGSYLNYSNNTSILTRKIFTSNFEFNYVGFRIVLYIS